MRAVAVEFAGIVIQVLHEMLESAFAPEEHVARVWMGNIMNSDERSMCRAILVEYIIGLYINRDDFNTLRLPLEKGREKLFLPC